MARSILIKFIRNVQGINKYSSKMTLSLKIVKNTIFNSKQNLLVFWTFLINFIKKINFIKIERAI